MDWRLISRAVILFSIGFALALTLNLVQVWQFVSWPIVPLLACIATAIGMLYPYINLEPPEEAPDISKVMRCVAVFVGIYQASTKIDFSSYVELMVTMGALAVGMWWLFDRSRGGLGLSVAFTLLSTGLTHLLLNCYAFTSIDTGFLYSRLWCIYFSGCITFGTIGRRLAAAEQQQQSILS